MRRLPISPILAKRLADDRVLYSRSDTTSRGDGWPAGNRAARRRPGSARYESPHPHGSTLCGVCYLRRSTVWIPSDTVLVLGDDLAQVDISVQTLLGAPENAALSHVIAIERVGPSRIAGDFGQSGGDSWREHVSCRSPIRSITDAATTCAGCLLMSYTAPLHRVLEIVAAHRAGVRTIGVGDGGNELGMGAIPWHEVRQRLAGPAAPLIPCRIATDWTILAGVSNWGAQALAAGCLARHGRFDVLETWTAALEEQRLQQLVQAGLAVDGVTRQYEPTVDGLPFLTYIQPWEGMRRLMLETFTS